MLIRVNEDGVFLKAENVAAYTIREREGHVWRVSAVTRGLPYSLGEFGSRMEAEQALHQLFLEMGEQVVQVMEI